MELRLHSSAQDLKTPGSQPAIARLLMSSHPGTPPVGGLGRGEPVCCVAAPPNTNESGRCGPMVVCVVGVVF